MKTPKYTKYIIRISAGISTKESTYQLPKILPEIKIPLMGDYKIGEYTADLVSPTGYNIIAYLKSQYQNEYDELVLIYILSSVEKN